MVIKQQGNHKIIFLSNSSYNILLGMFEKYITYRYSVHKMQTSIFSSTIGLFKVINYLYM